jgi:beta-lactamase superfamily II metal-dependent hydrolase
MRVVFFLLILLAVPCFAGSRPNDLVAYFIDVEGGQATLIITPEGESVLIDAGWPGHESRDADRIAAAAKLAKIKRIDYFVLTHYHADHMGGVPQLVEKIPVGTFVDHGPNREQGNAAQLKMVQDYEKTVSGAQHLVVKVGDHLPIKGQVDAMVVSADGKVLQKPLPSGGNPNTFCAATPEKQPDPTENAHSLGTYWHWGAFRMVDLGDLTWNKEKELVCPVNRLGKMDVFVVSHHGIDWSNSPALIHDMRPRVAIMDNGARKGGSPSTYNTLKTTDGLEDIWQLHYSDEGGKEHNAFDSYIANVDEKDEKDAGHYLKLTVHEDGSFDIYNSRNKFSHSYSAKAVFGRYKWETR